MGSPVPADDLPSNIVPADDLPTQSAAPPPQNPRAEAAAQLHTILGREPTQDELASAMTQGGSSHMTAGHIARQLPQASGELGLTGLTGLYGGIGGAFQYLKTLATTGDADQAANSAKGFLSAHTYVPRSDVGQGVLGVVGQTTAQAPIDAYKAAAYNLANLGNKVTPQASNGAPLFNPQASGNIAGKEAEAGAILSPLIPVVGALSGAARSGALANVARSAAERFAFQDPEAAEASGATASSAVPASPAMQRVNNLQLNVAPSEVNGGILGRAVESVTSSAKLKRENALANAPKLNDYGAEELGISTDNRNPGQVISPDDIARAKAPYIAIRESAGTAGDVPLQASDFSNIKAAGTLKNAQVEALLDHYRNMPSIDAKDLLADASELRAQGSANIKAPYQPAQHELGFAQRKVADVLESSLGDKLQTLQDLGESPVSLQDFQNARQQFAKVRSVEDALDDNGNLSAADLHKQLEHGVPLSGRLKEIAQAYGNFKGSLQPVANIKETGPGMLGPLGAAMAGFAAHGPVGYAAGFATGFAPWLVRQALRSDVVQNSLRNAPGPGVGITPGYQAALRAVAAVRNQALEEASISAALRRTTAAARHAQQPQQKAANL